MGLARGLLADAAAGRPRVLVVTGPAGVGKSTLARYLTAEAAQQGARILWGAGQEDLAIPYLPIASAFEGLRDVGHPEPLVLDGDPTAAWAHAADSLLEASARPLLFVIDDLQWTDPATQGLILHLLVHLEHAAQTRPVRCLWVVTVRTPVDGPRTIETLARIRREPGVEDLPLTGLDRLAVADLVENICSCRPSPVVVQRVAESCGGNPLLIQSLVRRGLAEERIIQRDGALWLRDPADHLAADLSELDRGVLAQLEEVSDDAQQLLTVAAFLGDEQSVAELLAVAGDPVSGDELLEEVFDAGLLLDRGSRCAFPHPQVRHVLFHRPRSRQRRLLHLAIAESLIARHGDEAALQISHHLARAGQLVEPGSLARWSALAAEQARAQGAWADASIAAAQAVEAGRGTAHWEEQLDLHILATDMASYDFDLATAVRHGTEAIELAKEHGDAERWGTTVLPLARALVTRTTAVFIDLDPAELLQEFLDANPDASKELRARVLSLLSEISAAADRPDRAFEAATLAARLLDDTSDPEVRGLVLVAEGMARWARLDLVGAADVYERTIEAVGLDPARRAGMYASVRLNLVRHLAGDVASAVESGIEVVERLGAAHIWGEHGLAAAALATSSLSLGRFDVLERLGEVVETSVRRSGYLEPPGVGFPAVALGRALRGDGRGAEEAIAQVVVGPGMQARYRAAIRAVLGDVDRVRAAVAERPWRDPPSDLSLRSIAGTALHAEVAAAIGDQSMVEAALPPLIEGHARGVRLSHGWATLLARAIADCHIAMERWDEAGEWLAVAAEEAAEHGLVLEAARVELSRARLLALDPSGDDRARAEQAELAFTALDELGALALVATARQLGLAGREVGAPASRAILFTDLVGSTNLNVQVGDRAFLELVREHNTIVRRCLRRSSGVEFKHTGDGVAAWFTSPVDAVECSIAINRELAAGSALHPDQQLVVRCGISSGEPLGNEGDLFGLSVVLAARLCAAAGDGEILVGPEIAGPARAHGVVLRERGPMSLKGFPDPIDVYVAVMTDAIGAAR
jgi:class 3 adenylate cyclase